MSIDDNFKEQSMLDSKEKSTKNTQQSVIDVEDKELVRKTLGFFKHKTGWIDADENLPVAIKPTALQPNKSNEKTSNAHEKSLTDSVVGHGKKVFSRALFHVKAWGTGILMQVLTGMIPSSLNMTFGMTGLSSIFGMFLLFPYHANHVATLMGLLAGLLCVATGFWPIAIAVGGLVTALIHIVNRRSVPLSFFFILPLLFISLSVGFDIRSMANMPLWFYGGVVVSIVLGILSPRWLVKLSNKLLGIFEKKTVTAIEEQEILIKTAESEMAAELSAFPTHLKELEKLQKQLPLVPEDIAGQLNDLGLKAKAILKCMNDDPRDVMAGNQFLNRYLPMINTSVEQFITLFENSHNALELENTKEQIVRVLADMNNAFSQAHQRLIDNDVDDLLISLKVMDKLRKSDGYDQ